MCVGGEYIIQLYTHIYIFFISGASKIIIFIQMRLVYHIWTFNKGKKLTHLILCIT